MTDVADGFDGQMEINRRTRGYRRWPHDVKARIVAKSGASKIVPEVAQRLVGALELLCVGMALVPDHPVLADPCIALAKNEVTFFASSTSRSLARFRSLALVENVMITG